MIKADLRKTSLIHVNRSPNKTNRAIRAQTTPLVKHAAQQGGALKHILFMGMLACLALNVLLQVKVQTQ